MCIRSKSVETLSPLYAVSMFFFLVSVRHRVSRENRNHTFSILGKTRSLPEVTAFERSYQASTTHLPLGNAISLSRDSFPPRVDVSSAKHHQQHRHHYCSYFEPSSIPILAYGKASSPCGNKSPSLTSSRVLSPPCSGIPYGINYFAFCHIEMFAQPTPFVGYEALLSWIPGWTGLFSIMRKRRRLESRHWARCAVHWETV